jgi:hypothetical protein
MVHVRWFTNIALADRSAATNLRQHLALPVKGVLGGEFEAAKLEPSIRLGKGLPFQ